MFFFFSVLFFCSILLLVMIWMISIDGNNKKRGWTMAGRILIINSSTITHFIRLLTKWHRSICMAAPAQCMCRESFFSQRRHGEANRQIGRTNNKHHPSISSNIQHTHPVAGTTHYQSTLIIQNIFAGNKIDQQPHK